MNSNYVKAFCTPPFLPITDFDTRALSDAKREKLPFEYGYLNYYSWNGDGRKILLVHGWGSRASHMALIARTLANSDFQVITYDAPAHASLSDISRSELSNFFEFSRAVAQVSKYLGPFHAIIGHSLGAIATVFAITGKSLTAGNQIQADKLILMGMPVYLENLVTIFCKIHGLDINDCLQLKNDLELSFNFLFTDFSVGNELKEISEDVLFIQDKDDEFSLEDLENLRKSYPDTTLFTTQGAGHQKMIMNRQVIARIRDFLLD